MLCEHGNKFPSSVREKNILYQLHNYHIVTRIINQLSLGCVSHLPNVGCKLKYIPYFSIDNAHLIYNAHPKHFRHSF
jgi:hypothetical protein